MQACAGAHAAHELKGPSGEPENLVHRDLSPHNLMVSGGGHVKLLDFGVAKAAFNPDKTETGVLKGKYGYMSPEQLEAGVLDRRSDIFTLATVLWEIIAGRPLFTKMSTIRTIHSVLNGPIRELSDVREGSVHPSRRSSPRRSVAIEIPDMKRPMLFAVRFRVRRLKRDWTPRWMRLAPMSRFWWEPVSKNAKSGLKAGSLGACRGEKTRIPPLSMASMRPIFSRRLCRINRPSKNPGGRIYRYFCQWWAPGGGKEGAIGCLGGGCITGCRWRGLVVPVESRSFRRGESSRRGVVVLGINGVDNGPAGIRWSACSSGFDSHHG